MLGSNELLEVSETFILCFGLRIGIQKLENFSHGWFLGNIHRLDNTGAWEVLLKRTSAAILSMTYFGFCISSL